MEKKLRKIIKDNFFYVLIVVMCLFAAIIHIRFISMEPRGKYTDYSMWLVPWIESYRSSIRTSFATGFWKIFPFNNH